jgi:hypothetical protein
MAKERAPVYLRFVVARTHDNTGLKNGLFNDAYALLRGDTLSGIHRKQLDGCLAWFDDHLPVPARFNSSTSKGAARRKSRGISWIKPDAAEHISRMRELGSILNEYGIKVTMIKTRRPGRIVYEDEWQIVAEPFADTGA